MESSAPVANWLESVGFPGRVSWPSAKLHLGPAEIPDTLSTRELLETVPGISIEPARGDDWGVRYSRDGSAKCAPDVFLNGSAALRYAFAGADRMLTLDTGLPLERLDGIEVHIGSGGPIGHACGEVLTWVRAEVETGDPGFTGSIAGSVEGSNADTVTSVFLPATGERRPVDSEGSFGFDELLPGRYEMQFFSGPALLYTRTTRVYAFVESKVTVELGRD